MTANELSMVLGVRKLRRQQWTTLQTSMYMTLSATSFHWDPSARNPFSADVACDGRFRQENPLSSVKIEIDMGLRGDEGPQSQACVFLRFVGEQ